MQKYPELENLIRIVKILDELKIPYYVTGGFAVSVYGRPRFTADIDIVIKMKQANTQEFTEKVLKVFPKGYVDQDQIRRALKNIGEFNVIDPESGLTIDFFIFKDSEFEQDCLKRTISKDIGYEVKFVSPEDLIINKLLWYRESESTRQLEDIASVMDIQTDADHSYIKNWVAKLGLQNEWQALEKIRK